jgi:small-conductance mechanosensitive channel
MRVVITRVRVVAAVILVLLLGCLASPADTAATSTSSSPNPKAETLEPATIEFWNRPIAVLRSNLAGASPADRADKAGQRLNELPLYVRAKDIELHNIKVEDQEGSAFTYQGHVLFFIGQNDLDKETNENIASVAQSALRALDDALQAREDEHKWPKIRTGILYTTLGLALLAAFTWLVWRTYHNIYGYLRQKEHSSILRLHVFGIDLLPHIASLIYTLLRAVGWFFTIGAAYWWLTLSLGWFPYTQPWGQRLGGYVVRFFERLGLSAVNSLPGIFACIVIFLITRWIVKLGHAFFLQVAIGRMRLSWMDAEVARATERIFTFVAWIFAVVVAYPYIPGSSTEAFKGVSVFFGLVISLGSTGIINQIMSGLFVVYSKALKTGDWVVVNETEGEVEEVGLLSVKIRTIEQQEVTIPHSVIVGTFTKNFSRLGQTDSMAASCTVTIGYDTPWRQVHALLLMAAERTNNILSEPRAYVLQRALSDFNVEYTLIVRLVNPHLRVETLSELHGNVLDVFNEYGVQIMSPHFMMQPETSIVVPRSKWHEPPAAPDNGSAANQRGNEAGR